MYYIFVYEFVLCKFLIGETRQIIHLKLDDPSSVTDLQILTGTVKRIISYCAI